MKETEPSKPADERPKCSWCGGEGHEPPLPNLTGVSQNKLAKLAGVDPSSLSRIFTSKADQQRKDPKLSTLRKLQRAIQDHTGVRVPLDLVAGLLDG